MPGRSQQSRPAAGLVGLTPYGFTRAFPFHLACDDELRVVQIGESLARIAPDVRPGTPIQRVFVSARPACDLSHDFLLSRAETLLLLEHRESRIPFRGQFLRTEGPAGWVFLGSPWFSSAEALEAAGLTLNDFALHDPIAELLLVGQTQRMSIADLSVLNERLGRKSEDLRRTESLYRSAIAAANAVAYQEDFAADTFKYVGEGFAKLTGYESNDIRPSQLRALLLPMGEAGDDTRRTTFMAGASGLRRSDDYQFRTRSGELRWFSDSFVVVTDSADSPVGAIGILEDITSRKQGEERLRNSEAEAQRLALVANRTSNGVLLLDAGRRVEWVNAGFTRLMGYTNDEFRGKVIGDNVLGARDGDPEPHQAAVQAMLEGRVFHDEVKLRRRDGSICWVAAEIQPVSGPDGEVTGFIVVGTDITEQKLYEQRLAQLHDELDAVLKVIPGGVVAFDADGRVAYCNLAFADIVGRSADELEGVAATDVDALLANVSAPDDPPEQFLSLAEDRVDTIRLVKPRPAIIARTVRAIRGQSAANQWRACYLRDITHEAEVDRMKSEFLSTAAHELRTPMSSVHGFAELLVSRDFDAETARTIARTIHRQSSALVQMVNDLLDLARIEAGRGRDVVLTRLSLAAIVRETVEGILIKGESRKVDLIPATGDEALVDVDAALLRQAVTNVLSNAYKYSRGKGAIRLTLPTRNQGSQRQVGVRVADEGIGMTPEQLGRLFERFYRADPSGAIPGTGLGLTLVKEITEAMHGSVDVVSEVGRGTTVTLWFPAVVAE
jgi:PAS domain S-box-containing protein